MLLSGDIDVRMWKSVDVIPQRDFGVILEHYSCYENNITHPKINARLKKYHNP